MVRITAPRIGTAMAYHGIVSSLLALPRMTTMAGMERNSACVSEYNTSVGKCDYDCGGWRGERSGKSKKWQCEKLDGHLLVSKTTCLTMCRVLAWHRNIIFPSGTII